MFEKSPVVLSGLLLIFALLLTSPGVGDAPYVWLTGYSASELEELAFLPEGELERRLGLPEVPGGFVEDGRFRGRAAHAIASYLGTRRWGPNVTIAMGYLREIGPAIVHRRDIDPGDIAANYAGVAYALNEAQHALPRAEPGGPRSH